MATIDTYQVRIDPIFDVKKFTSIKKQIEGLAKLGNIPIKLAFNRSSFTGIKSQLSKEIKNKNIIAKIPVDMTLQGKSLSGLKGQMSGIKFKPFEYPVHFSLRGAKTQLLNDLKGLSFKPITIPARIQLTGGGLGNIQNQISNLQANVTTKTKTDDDGRRNITADILTYPFRKSWDVTKNTMSATANVARYGVGASVIYGGLEMAKAPFLVEDYLYTLKAQQGEFEKVDIKTMRDAITDISEIVPKLSDEIAATALEMGRANISAKDIFGLGEGGTFNIKDSLLYPTVTLAAYANERAENVFKLFKQLQIFDPKMSKVEMANIVAGATDISTFTLQNMSSYLSRANIGALRDANIDLKSIFGIMSLSSAMGFRPEDAGTALKTFEQFTKQAKSKSARVSMETLGLRRYNPEGTAFLNFRNFLEDIINIQDKIRKGGGKAVINGKSLTKEDVNKLTYEIGGADAARIFSAIGIEGVREMLADFDKILTNANLEEKLSIRGQGAFWKFRLLISQIQNAFIEAFDEQTLRAIADIFKEIALYMKEFVMYIKESGGLSGIFKELKLGILEILDLIPGVDTKSMIERVKASSNGFIIDKQIISNIPIGGRRDYGVSQYSSNPNYKFRYAEPNMLGPFMPISNMYKPLSSSAMSPVQQTNAITMFIDGSRDPKAVADEVTNRISALGVTKESKSYMDSIVHPMSTMFGR